MCLKRHGDAYVSEWTQEQGVGDYLERTPGSHAGPERGRSDVWEPGVSATTCRTGHSCSRTGAAGLREVGEACSLRSWLGGQARGLGGPSASLVGGVVRLGTGPAPSPAVRGEVCPWLGLPTTRAPPGRTGLPGRTCRRMMPPLPAPRTVIPALPWHVLTLPKSLPQSNE